MIYLGVPAAHLLWRHVRDGSHDDAGGSFGSYRRSFGVSCVMFLGSDQLGQTEVQNLDVSVFGDEEVVGLQVPMDDAFLMRRGQTAQNLHGIVERLAHRETL